MNRSAGGMRVADRVLFVDDEPGVLDAYERLLRKEYHVNVAQSGAEGLEAIEKLGPFSVVISDMRMPGMNGAEFLAKVRVKSPNSVRMLLTGYADLNAAIQAVNEGNIFKFLTKPCKKEILTEAIDLGLAEYRAITAERELAKKAQIIDHFVSERDTADVCQWDNFNGPTGLGGPTQAKTLLAPLFGADAHCYVVLLTISSLQTMEERYGEEAAGDFVNIVAKQFVETLRSEEHLFHWERNVLMAVVYRHLSPASMRMEMGRLTQANREHVLAVRGRTMMIASPITFEVYPVSQFSNLDEMIAAFSLTAFGKN